VSQKCAPSNFCDLTISKPRAKNGWEWLFVMSMHILRVQTSSKSGRPAMQSEALLEECKFALDR